MPALIAKFHHAKLTGAESVEIWGTGQPRREFLYVDDLADAVVHVMRTFSEERHINIGTGTDVTIAELATIIADVAGFTGTLAFDTSKPDGTPRKLLDVTRLRELGWTAHTAIKDGLRQTYDWFRKHRSGTVLTA